MSKILLKDLPPNKGKKLLMEAAEIGQMAIGPIELNSDGVIIVGLCVIIQELKDEVEKLKPGAIFK